MKKKSKAVNVELKNWKNMKRAGINLPCFFIGKSFPKPIDLYTQCVYNEYIRYNKAVRKGKGKTMARTTYEVNFYPVESGDGIYKMCRTKKQAIKECENLHKKYPDRDGDAFIKVWYDYGGLDEEHISDIEPEEWQNE